MKRYLCLSRDVEPNGYRRVRGFGQDLLISRSRHGNVFVDENSCRHRGFPMAEEEAGKLPLRCPYHDLVFQASGVMASEVFGFVFLGAPSEINWLPEVGHLMLDLGQEFGKHEMEVEAPYQLWMQNTMDPAHLGTVHRGGFAKLFPNGAQPYDWQYQTGQSAYKIPVLPEVAVSYSRYTEQSRPYFMHASIGPSLSLTNFLGVFCSVETAEPIDEKRCFVRTRFFLDRNTHDVPGKLQHLALAANRVTLREDKEVVERWARGNFQREPGLWLPGEERIQHYLGFMYEEGYL